MPASSGSRFQVGFRASIIALFVGIVLFVGLALVYLSFSRVKEITRSAASSFLDTVAEVSADRIDAQLKTGARQPRNSCRTDLGTVGGHSGQPAAARRAGVDAAKQQAALQSVYGLR